MPEAKTLGELLDEASAKLIAAGIETPALDARILLQEASGFPHAKLISEKKSAANVRIENSFCEFVTRRIAGEPVHRIIGKREFFGREFRLSPETLIPRPDTEILVGSALDILTSANRPARILDLCTGSGIIGVTLCCEVPGIEVIATDISIDALRTAEANADTHGVGECIEFENSDMFGNVDGLFDLIVSNPPYIPTPGLSELQTEVRDHDPALALDGGEDGLDFYRVIFGEGREYLNKNGAIAVELGIGQAQAVREIGRENGFGSISVTKDLSGIERVLVAQV